MNIICGSRIDLLKMQWQYTCMTAEHHPYSRFKKAGTVYDCSDGSACELKFNTNMGVVLLLEDIPREKFQ